MMKVGVVAMGLMLCATGAWAQAPKPAADPVVTAYQLGLQTGQEIATELKAADDKLKWVIDNWVPKQPEEKK